MKTRLRGEDSIGNVYIITSISAYVYPLFPFKMYATGTVHVLILTLIYSYAYIYIHIYIYAYMHIITYISAYVCLISFEKILCIPLLGSLVSLISLYQPYQPYQPYQHDLRVPACVRARVYTCVCVCVYTYV